MSSNGVHERFATLLWTTSCVFSAGLTPLCLQLFLESRRPSRKPRTEAAVLSSISEKKAELSVKSPR